MPTTIPHTSHVYPGKSSTMTRMFLNVNTMVLTKSLVFFYQADGVLHIIEATNQSQQYVTEIQPHHSA
ncbi:hypothetical protein BC937DRAFT_87294 [Endogone sp. FLAS-F59071]|nr:hypothetical protein BC937DRAFT_87294 [Endogone sp. FLAS-F59071]|eukprot:RUS12664.1 hypothetical protein BC937DRAFT_87294 [Endogone sp. FLAS-F59071]